MKISYLAPLVLATAVATDSQQPLHFLRRRSLGVEDDEWNEIQTDWDAPVGGCAQVKDNKVKKYQGLILGDCNAPKRGWRLDDNGLFHTELDPSYCIQAGKHGKVKDGEKARLVKCDPSEPLQKFEYIRGGIRPATNTDFCMVWRGVIQNLNVDPLIFKNCDEQGGKTAWSGDW